MFSGETPPVSTLPQTYQGFKPYAVDPKYRIAVPRAWRPAGNEVLYLLFSKTNGMPNLKVLTERSFNHRVELIQNSELPEGRKRKLLGRLAGLCREVSLNDQGKLTIPKDLAEKAEIKADGAVVQIGRWDCFELWDAELFDKNLDLEMNEEVEDELGIF